jgi:DNA polymerase-3 subunit gamma/tau
MSYLVFARKYRPQTFEEMVGQKAVVQTLQNAIKADRVAQAYLFSGMRGVGKTTAARILAKALNCQRGPTPTPCNVCEFCVEINEDRSVDYMEIDGASNRGIDDIRSLREVVKYRAFHSRKKIIYIDEVHQITKDGFNALLKTLEEPPPNTIFIFATTEFHKVPATIVSRCQHFEFKRASQRDIINHLMNIARKEGITITPYGLGLIAVAAEGSIRDSQSLLDKAVAFCGEHIDDADLKEILGTINRDLLFEFSSAVIAERADQIFPLVEKVLDAGHDLRTFARELVQHFRNLLVVRTMSRPEDILLFNVEEMDRLRSESEKATDEELLRYLQALQAGEPGLRYSSHPQILFETLLVKLCHFRKLVPMKDLIQDFGRTAKDLPSGTAFSPTSSPASRKNASRAETSASAVSSPSAAATRPSPVPRTPPRPTPGPLETKEPAASAPAEPSGAERDADVAKKHPGVKVFMDKMKGRVVSVEPVKGGRSGEEE